MPDVFWGLTPWQLKCCIDAQIIKNRQAHDESCWIMWHGAALGRVDRMPPLENFMSDKKEVRGIDEAAIIGRLKQYQRIRESADGSSS